MTNCPVCGGKLLFLVETVTKDYFELDRVKKEGKSLDRSIPCDGYEATEEYLECGVCQHRIRQ